MKTSIFLISAIALFLTSCVKNDSLPDTPIGVDPNEYNLELKLAEARKEGEQWAPIVNGDTLRFNWSLFPPASSEPVNSKFGPGDFSNSSNNPLLGIGKAGIFYSKDEQVFFSTYNNTTKETVLIDSGKYRLEGDYFYLKKKGSETKFRILKGHYKP
ncbi:hypothetical protein J7E50_02865 [Pedobacter sp. ISL-68]|uniref:hypothetical protein n=1 Tax=unclassified Pedobacter TaxID=2628915 RepID=UPI001BE7AE6C|nr:MULTISPECIES: hypothetical protein [unclassified Pedobacter]MBT2560162.1 hypothetical protein [Pedobacter sp. ISL-64]MBT2589141.1 hypothetical protein [Pedobacter sp. ISL-68]